MTNHHLPRRTLTYDISCQVRNGLIQGLFITHFVISYKSANEYHFPLGQIEILCPVSSVVSIKMWSHFPNSCTETTDRSQHFSPASFLQPNANQRARKKMESIKILVSTISPFLLCTTIPLVPVTVVCVVVVLLLHLRLRLLWFFSDVTSPKFLKLVALTFFSRCLICSGIIAYDYCETVVQCSGKYIRFPCQQ